jgi:hypothetical protein
MNANHRQQINDHRAASLIAAGIGVAYHPRSLTKLPGQLSRCYAECHPGLRALRQFIT